MPREKIKAARIIKLCSASLENNWKGLPQKNSRSPELTPSFSCGWHAQWVWRNLQTLLDGISDLERQKSPGDSHRAGGFHTQLLLSKWFSRKRHILSARIYTQRNNCDQNQSHAEGLKKEASLVG